MFSDIVKRTFVENCFTLKWVVLRTASGQMDNSWIWIVDHLQSLIPDSLTKVSVLPVHKKAFIEKTHLVKSLSPNKHGRPRNPINCLSCLLIVF